MQMLPKLFLNKELLKSDQVGYKLNESFPMYEVTETWKTLLGLQSAIQNLEKDKKTWWSQESETQLNDLLMYYQKNWQELSNVH